MQLLLANKKYLTTLLTCLIIFGGALYNYNLTKTNLNSINRSIVDLKTKIDSEGKSIELEKLELETWKEADDILPKYYLIDSLLNSGYIIRSTALTSNLQVTSIMYLIDGSKEINSIYHTPININVKGSFDDCIEFMRSIRDLKADISINSTVITEDTISMSLTSYSMGHKILNNKQDIPIINSISSSAFGYVHNYNKTNTTTTTTVKSIVPTISFDVPKETFELPYPLGVKATLSSPYGKRIDPLDPNNLDFHYGIDLACAEGTTVKSVSDATVMFAGVRGDLGNTIVLKDSKAQYIYGQLSKIYVEEGGSVKVNELIGEVGSTGRVIEPHLHFAISVNDTFVDPVEYIGQ